MEPTEFEQIVSEHYESLYRFAFSLARTEADARDLTQHTFYVWAAKGQQLRDRSKAKTWLFTTLYRTFLEGWRKRQRYPQCSLDELGTEESPMLTAESVDTADHLQVLAALAQIDEIYRAAVALFYLKECSYQEIAEIVQVPLGTVKSRLARGLAQLRRILRPETFSPAPEISDGNLTCASAIS